MFRTFVFGLVVGIAATVGLVYSKPIIDLHRESSLIEVRPNGGDTETFYISLPGDRILSGAHKGGQTVAFPKSLQWPDESDLKGLETEVFILRNSEGIVVGIAARISNALETSGPFIQWMIDLPARGTMFVRMDATLGKDGYRNGLLMTGTREFETLNGSVNEFYNATANADEPDTSGRLELVAALVGSEGEAP